MKKMPGLTMVNPNERTKDHKVEKLSPENLERANGLQLEIEGDFSRTLAALNEHFGTEMESRDGGFHVSIVTPRESKVLRKTSLETQREVNVLLDDFALESDLDIIGIGYIDGSKRDDLREVDQGKKVAFLAVDSPKLRAIREALGLDPDFDMHITLGFEVNDIHEHIVGYKDTGGAIKESIEKKADPDLNGFLETLPDDIRISRVEVVQR